MKLYHLKEDSLTQIVSNPFKLERDIQNVVENNVDELFGVEFVKSEFSISGFRFDTLCFDSENNTFVIIEYKKGSSYSVIDQGFTYLSILLNNKSDFILEYNETKNQSLKRDEIDWSQSRIIFVSPKFNDYQINSVNFKDIPFELWEIRRYKNDTIGLQQIVSKSNESVSELKNSNQGVLKQVKEEIQVFTEQNHLDRVDENLREVYFSLRDKILEWDDIEIKYKRQYVSFGYGNKNFLYVNFTKKHLRIEFLKKGITLKDPYTPFEIYGRVYWYRLNDVLEVDRCLVSIKEKYESVK